MAVFDCNNTSLKKGSTGENVKKLQEYLKTWKYYNRQVDEDYGYYTVQAVKSFQRQYNLTVDGWFGPKTCKKFNEVTNTKETISKNEDILSFDCPHTYLKRGMKNEQVTKLQTMLQKIGIYTGRLDGDFGRYTEESVKEFQTMTNHTPDGVFGPKTCPDLNSYYATKTNANVILERGVEDTQPTRHILTVLSEVVVLPETDYSTDGTKTSTGGSINTDTNFDCSIINLKRGSKGEDVKKLQTVLKARGYYTRQIDGDFGKYTASAVKKLQTEQGNTPDGVFGPKTCNKLQSTSSTSNSANKNTNTKFTITTFKGVPQINADVDGLTDEITVTTPYTQELYSKIRMLQKTEFQTMIGNTIIRRHAGYINNIKLSHEDDETLIELTLVNYVAFLEQTVEITSDKTGKRSALLKEFIEMAGLKANIDLTGLTDDEYTIKAQTSGTSSSGECATMSIEEIYKIACTFSYGGQGTGTSPQKAYDLYQNGCRTFDCYDATNWLCYMLHTFAKVKCRCLQTASNHSRSGTHRVAQIYQNGSWICPEQAWSMTRNLRPFRPPESPGGVVIKYTLDVNDAIF